MEREEVVILVVFCRPDIVDQVLNRSEAERALDRRRPESIRFG